MVENILILPLQLFDPKELRRRNIELVYIVEEPYYFTRYRFHKQKLVYQRSCMKHFEQEVKDLGLRTKYIEYDKVCDDTYSSLDRRFGSKLFYYDPIDKQMQKKLKKKMPNTQIEETPNYWISNEEMQLFKRKKRYNFGSLYQYQKEKFVNLLQKRTDFGINKSKSQDIYNRNKIQKKEVPKSSLINLEQDTINHQSIQYIQQKFKNNYGILEDKILYPITRKQALKWLNQFFKEKLFYFGKYQDAIDLENPYLYHSIISPMLNVGLLTDSVVILQLIKFLYKKKVNIPIESLEAFIRQIIAWRNYIYMIYTLEKESLYRKNQLKHYNKLNKAFWTGNTGIEVIDKHIEILNVTSYLSHIPRLMLFGNLMLLLQIDPIEVLKWFMTMFIDACDCLMVPNIIISQNNSPILMTRPYFSSFNYIQQMSNTKYPEQDKLLWNTLFYGFLLTHQQIALTSYVYASTTQKLLMRPQVEQNKIKQLYIQILAKLTH